MSEDPRLLRLLDTGTLWNRLRDLAHSLGLVTRLRLGRDSDQTDDAVRQRLRDTDDATLGRLREAMRSMQRSTRSDIELSLRVEGFDNFELLIQHHRTIGVGHGVERDVPPAVWLALLDPKDWADDHVWLAEYTLERVTSAGVARHVALGPVWQQGGDGGECYALRDQSDTWIENLMIKAERALISIEGSSIAGRRAERTEKKLQLWSLWTKRCGEELARRRSDAQAQDQQGST